MNKKYYTLINQCRSCGSTAFSDIYKANSIPVAGIYYDLRSTPVNIKAPITLLSCETCGLIQLKETINPNIYLDYNFAGNFAVSYLQHLEKIADKLVTDWNIIKKTVFEIGASNGILLRYLADRGNNKVSGVEPSLKLCNDAIRNGLKICQGYFSKDFIVKNHVGKFHCVIIRHVLEHVDDLNDFAANLKLILKKDGLLVVEVPDIEETMDNNLYSNIFHEHLNYFSVTSLNNLLNKYGFYAVYQTRVDIHGGSVLLFYQLNDSIKDTQLTNFKKTGTPLPVNPQNYYSHIHKKIVRLNKKYKSVHGYGASHRTFILMGNSRLSSANIPFIYDKNTFLHDRKLNGLHSLILPVESIFEKHPEAIVIFALSYEDEISGYLTRKCNFKGEIISLRYTALCNQ